MNILKKFLIKQLSDTQVLSHLFRVNVMELDTNKKYILLLDSPVDADVESLFIKELSGYDIVLITGAKGQLLELEME